MSTETETAPAEQLDEPTRFAALRIKYTWDWMQQVVSAPKDPASRALVLAKTNVYPPAGFTPEQLEAIIQEKMKAPDWAFEMTYGHKPRSAAPRVRGANIDIAGLRATRNTSYVQTVSETEQAGVEIPEVDLISIIEQAFEDCGRDPSDDDLMDAIEEGISSWFDDDFDARNANWHNDGDSEYGDGENYESESPSLEVDRRTDYNNWLQEQIDNYRNSQGPQS